MNTATKAPTLDPKMGAEELDRRIGLIIDLIPDGYEKKALVVRLLNNRRESIPYTAPEVIGARWHEVGTILSDNLPDPETVVWAKEISTLFGKPLK